MAKLIQQARNYSGVIIAALLLTVFSGCTPGKEDGRSDPLIPTLPPPEDPRLSSIVPDRGHSSLVTRFFAAARAGDADLISNCLSAYALEEINVQYRSIATGDNADVKGIESYARACKNLLVVYQYTGISKNFSDPWQQPGDRGHYMEIHMIRKDAVTGRVLGFYFEPNSAGELRIDNIVTQEPFQIGTSAPAIGPTIATHYDAYRVYFHGAVLAEQPLHEPLPGEPPLDTAHRLAFLRAVSTRGFLDRIRRDPEFKGSVVGFLDAGAHVFRNDLRFASTHNRYNDSFFFVEFEYVNKKPGSRPIYHRLDMVRLHGQFRLDRTTVVEYLPGHGG